MSICPICPFLEKFKVFVHFFISPLTLIQCWERMKFDMNIKYLIKFQFIEIDIEELLIMSFSLMLKGGRNDLLSGLPDVGWTTYNYLCILKH